MFDSGTWPVGWIGMAGPLVRKTATAPLLSSCYFLAGVEDLFSDLFRKIHKFTGADLQKSGAFSAEFTFICTLQGAH